MDKDLQKQLMNKYNVSDEQHAEWLIRNFGGMYHLYLTKTDFGKVINGRMQSQAEKLQDCLQTTEDCKMVVEYVVRHDFPHLINLL